jgi:hypothetical protein
MPRIQRNISIFQIHPFASLASDDERSLLYVIARSAKILSSSSSSRPLAAEGSMRFLNVLAVWILRLAQDDGKGRRIKFFLAQPTLY